MGADPLAREGPRPLEERLRREVAFRLAIEESILAGVAAVDLEGRQTYVNSALAAMTGWPAEELVGRRPPFPYWPEEEVGRIEAAFAQTLAGSAPPGGFELRFKRRTGEKFDVLVLLSPLREEGELSGWLASVYDITERKQAEQRLREDEERLRLALDAGRLGAWEWEIGSSRVVWSPELEAIHGLEVGTFPGTFDAFRRDVHPEDEDRLLATVQKAVGDAPADYLIEYRIVRPDGSVRWLEARGRVLVGLDGSPVRMVGVCQDTTERRLEQERQRVLAEASTVLVPSLDFEDALRQLAAFCTRTLADYSVAYSLEPGGGVRRVGLAHVDPARQGWVEALSDAGPPRLDDEHGAGAVIRTGEAILASEIPEDLLCRAAQNEEHLRLLRRLGPRSSIVVPLRAQERTVGALALAATDRSGRRYTREDLALVQQLASRAGLLVHNALLYREAQQAVAARDEMMAVLSHDLKSPLHSVTLACELLRRGGSAPATHVDAIRRAAHQMDALIRDLLDVARIEHGQLSLDTDDLDVPGLLTEAVELHRPLAEEKGLHLHAEAAGPLPTVRGDRDRLQQVLANLIGNALKFAPAGSEVRLTSGLEGGHVWVAVSDRGRGIRAEELPHVFDRFWRSDRRAVGGTGLGLTIARAIVEAHGGSIEVASAPGEGTVFTFRLPASPV